MITIPSNPIPSIHATYGSQWTKQALDWSESTYNDLQRPPMTSNDHHHILTTFWIHFDYILATFWLHFGYILTAFWLHSDYILTTFWLPSGYILTKKIIRPKMIVVALCYTVLLDHSVFTSDDLVYFNSYLIFEAIIATAISPAPKVKREWIIDIEQNPSIFICLK